MKKSLHIILLLFPIVTFAQAPVIGTSAWNAANNQIQRNGGPAYNPQNGNDTLNAVYNNSACGLNYVMVTQRLGQRFVPIGNPQPAAFVVNMTPCAVIQQAFLYTEALGIAPSITANITNPANISSSFSMTNIGNSIDVCWGMDGTHVWRSDVTSCITGSGTYTLSGLPTTTSPNMFTVDCEGATLIIIYTDPYASYTGTLKIDDGCHTVAGGVLNHTMSGFSACANSTYASDFMIVGDMQMFTYTLNVNGSPVVQPQWDWWNEISATTSVTNGQSTCNYNLSGLGDCYTLAVAGLYFQTACSPCSPLQSNVTLVMTSTPNTCNGNGTASVSASGGSGNYTYLWSPGGDTTASVSGLMPGTYTVWVNDGITCSSAQVVLQNNGMNLAMSSTAVSCNLAGSASVVVTGGQAPYTYQWAPSGGTNAIATNLSAGNYTVTVTDNTACVMTNTVSVASYQYMLVSIIPYPDTCATSTGSAFANVYGGIPPYSYLWSPGGQTTATITGQSAGTYSCTITDNGGCIVIGSGIIVSSVPNVTSGGMGYMSCGDSLPLWAFANMNGTYSWSPATYLDNPNAQMPYCTSTVSITYTVTFTGACGVDTDTFSVMIYPINYLVEEICFVTIDTVINKNVVIWEKWNSPSTGFYNIYRETSSPGIYSIVGTQPISQFSTFTDLTSNPSSSPNRYALTTVNVCGQESDTTYHHRTIHNVITPNGPGWNLNWNAYEGLPIATYNILRGPTVGTMTVIASVPGNQLSYTDGNPPFGTNYYLVEAVHPFNGCTPLRLGNPQSLSGSGSYSNIFETNFVALNEADLLENSLAIFPNPGNGNFQITMTLSNAQNVLVSVFDNLGQIVCSKEERKAAGNSHFDLNLSDLNSGVYFVQVQIKESIFTKKLVIQ